MNAHVSLRIDRPTRRRFTVDDVAELVEAGVIDRDARMELLDGEIIDMPSEGEGHISAKALLVRAVNLALDERWMVVPDATLHLRTDDAPEPDVYVLPRGAPLKPVDPSEVALVIEIADTSIGHDLGRKAGKYAGYGLAEYWVVDLSTRQTHVLTRPDEGAYHDIDAVPFERELAASRLPLRLTLADLLGAA